MTAILETEVLPEIPLDIPPIEFNKHHRLSIGEPEPKLSKANS
jgi:hypothetical protein